MTETASRPRTPSRPRMSRRGYPAAPASSRLSSIVPVGPVAGSRNRSCAADGATAARRRRAVFPSPAGLGRRHAAVAALREPTIRRTFVRAAARLAILGVRRSPPEHAVQAARLLRWRPIIGRYVNLASPRRPPGITDRIGPSSPGSDSVALVCTIRGRKRPNPARSCAARRTRGRPRSRPLLGHRPPGVQPQEVVERRVGQRPDDLGRRQVHHLRQGLEPCGRAAVDGEARGLHFSFSSG